MFRVQLWLLTHQEALGIPLPSLGLSFLICKMGWPVISSSVLQI